MGEPRRVPADEVTGRSRCECVENLPFADPPTMTTLLAGARVLMPAAAATTSSRCASMRQMSGAWRPATPTASAALPTSAQTSSPLSSSAARRRARPRGLLSATSTVVHRIFVGALLVNLVFRGRNQCRTGRPSASMGRPDVASVEKPQRGMSLPAHGNLRRAEAS